LINLRRPLVDEHLPVLRQIAEVTNWVPAAQGWPAATGAPGPARSSCSRARRFSDRDVVGGLPQKTCRSPMWQVDPRHA
jgi:hypothetical protein